MGTSTPGTDSRGPARGFTLVELAVVLFVLGLVLWVALPRLSRIGEPGRDAVFRALSGASEAAYDLSLFEKRETRLVLHPSDGTYEFLHPDRPTAQRPPPPPPPPPLPRGACRGAAPPPLARRGGPPPLPPPAGRDGRFPPPGPALL